MSDTDTDKLFEGQRARMDALLAREAARARAERRDRFAMAALQGLLAREAGDHYSEWSTPDGISKKAIPLADALIAALDASKP
jgi:hypothetical protein